MKEIKLTRGFVALIDDCDFERVIAAGPWSAAITPETIYAQHMIRDPDTGNRSAEKLGHFLLGLRDPKMTVRYADGNGCHCWRSNLCVVDKPSRWRQEKLNSRAMSGAQMDVEDTSRHTPPILKRIT
jgi:hypothetical protein